jgi:hypothetical protein
MLAWLFIFQVIILKTVHFEIRKLVAQARPPGAWDYDANMESVGCMQDGLSMAWYSTADSSFSLLPRSAVTGISEAKDSSQLSTVDQLFWALCLRP